MDPEAGSCEYCNETSGFIKCLLINWATIKCSSLQEKNILNGVNHLTSLTQLNSFEPVYKFDTRNSTAQKWNHLSWTYNGNRGAGHEDTRATRSSWQWVIDFCAVFEATYSKSHISHAQKVIYSNPSRPAAFWLSLHWPSSCLLTAEKVASVCPRPEHWSNLHAIRHRDHNTYLRQLSFPSVIIRLELGLGKL
jgi:hypothetical protein